MHGDTTLPLAETVEAVANFTPLEGLNDAALAHFGRIDRLRILAGADWCDCGCGLLDRTSYRTLANLTTIPLATLNKFTGTGRIYLTQDKLDTLARLSNLPVKKILALLECRSITKEF